MNTSYQPPQIQSQTNFQNNFSFPTQQPFQNYNEILMPAANSLQIQTASASPAIANKPIPNRPAPIPNRP
jgi:hypothetical protein